MGNTIGKTRARRLRWSAGPRPARDDRICLCVRRGIEPGGRRGRGRRRRHQHGHGAGPGLEVARRQRHQAGDGGGGRHPGPHLLVVGRVRRLRRRSRRRHLRGDLRGPRPGGRRPASRPPSSASTTPTGASWPSRAGGSYTRHLQPQGQEDRDLHLGEHHADLGHVHQGEVRPRPPRTGGGDYELVVTDIQNLASLVARGDADACLCLPDFAIPELSSGPARPRSTTASRPPSYFS